MPRLQRMPEVAADTDEATLTEWLVAEGAAFEAGDALATIETDKALVDIEAEQAGTMAAHLAKAGTRVAVGGPVVLIANLGEDIADIPNALQDLGVAAATGAPESDAQTAAGEVTNETTIAAAPGPDRGDEPEAQATSQESDLRPGSSRPDAGRRDIDLPPRRHGRVPSSPLARKLAAGAGLKIEDIHGTGPRGRVLKRDVVEATVRAQAPVAMPAPTHPGGASLGPQPSHPGQRNNQETSRSSMAASASSTAVSTPQQRVEHTRMRRAIATRMQQSKQEVPHFYLHASVRADKLVQLRSEINEVAGVKVSLNDLIVKAVAKAHEHTPELNVTWTDDAVVRATQVDVGIAVATDRGLLTPVIRDVGALSATAVSQTIRDLAMQARDGKIRQHDLEGGTISVTNLGMFGVEAFDAIINPPQAAILAVGAVTDEPVVVDGELHAAKILRLSLSVDHRPVDGATAAMWLQHLVAQLENPLAILA